MNARAITVILCVVLSRSVALTQDDRPIFKESTTNLVAVIEATARANFESACLAVTRDAAQKKLRIYAITGNATAGTVKHDDVEIEVIYHKHLAAEHTKAAGAYHQHNNGLVLCFAAAQFAAGRKALGVHLVKLLAEADPQMWWSSPTHGELTIQRILSGLEKDDASVREFLKDESKEWAYRVKNYKE
jgi:hypothetical protein